MYLEPVDKIIWDYSYHETVWEQKIVPQWIDAAGEKKYTWRESKDSKSIIYKSENKKDTNKIIKVEPRRQFRIGYFAKLFNVEENSIRTLKSTAIDSVNIFMKPVLQNIIKYIYAVDHPDNDNNRESTTEQMKSE